MRGFCCDPARRMRSSAKLSGSKSDAPKWTEGNPLPRYLDGSAERLYFMLVAVGMTSCTLRLQCPYLLPSSPERSQCRQQSGNSQLSLRLIASAVGRSSMGEAT